MTPDEERDLLAMSHDLAGALHDPFEPACVARAFAFFDQPSTLNSQLGTNGPVLTMQHWIDLSAIRSPLLVGELPGELADLEAAANLFGLNTEGLPEAEQVILAQVLLDAINDAFAMALPMTLPESVSKGDDDGFGMWLPLLAFLIVQCGESRLDALQYPVGEAYAIMAGSRRNQGWAVAGVPYALRGAGGSSQSRTLEEGPEATPTFP